jgi:aspartate aminotransferase
LYNDWSEKYLSVLTCLATDLEDPAGQFPPRTGCARDVLPWHSATLPIPPYISLSPGEAPCRHFFASLLSTKFSISSPLTYQQIVMTAGCSGALNVALRTFLNPTDKVLIFAPYYPEYPNWIRNYSGFDPVVIHTKPENNWEPDIAEVQQKLSTEKEIRAVILNSPNNPTGTVYSHEKIEGITMVIREALRNSQRPIWLLSDSVYVNLTDEQPPLFDMYRYTIVFNSISKDCGLPGLRVGCLIVNPQIPQWQAVVDHLSYTNDSLGFFGTSRLNQSFFQYCYENQKDRNSIVFEPEFKTELSGVHEKLTAALDEIGINTFPRSGIFARNFELVPEEILNDDGLQIALQEKGLKIKVSVPGSVFGCASELGDLVRISVENSQNEIEEEDAW